MKKTLAAIALAAAVALGVAPTSARQSAQENGGDEIQLSAQEVLVDVIVTDSKGNPVTDLRPDEVQVFEGGDRQEVTSFALVQSSGEQSTAVAGSKPPPSLELSPFRGFNYIIVVVDRTSLNQQDLKQTYAAAEKFVNERLQPNDLVAVFVAANKLVMVQNFTNSKEKLLDAMQAATDTSGNTVQLGRNGQLNTKVSIFTDSTSAGTGVSAAPTQAGGEAPPTAGGLGNTGSATANNIGTIVSELDALVADVDATYDDLVLQFQAIALVQDMLALMKTYSRIPGRKSVLLYSEGFVSDSSVEGAFALLISTANRNNFAFYTVDAAGLRPDTQTRLSTEDRATAGTGTILGNRSDRTLVDASGNSGLGRAERNVRTGGNGALNRLAVDTGGIPLRNNNDLNRGFEAVENDLRSYYALSYAPKNASIDGKFRPIEVKVTRKGVDVRTRKGYYSTPGGSDLLPFEQPVLAMVADAKPENRPSAIPVMLRIDRFRAKNGWAIPIYTHIAASDLEGAEQKTDKETRYNFEVDLIAIVRDTKNNILAKTSRSFLYASPKEQLEAFRQLDLINNFSQPLVLPPGTYKLTIAAYDPNAQKGTVIERAILLPKIANGAPMLSSVVLSRDVVAVAPADRDRLASDPLVFEGTTRIVPNPTGRFVKSRGDRLVTFFRFYGEPSKQYQVKLEFIREGQIVNASQPTDIPKTDAGGETSFAPTLPIDGLEPGAYVVHVVILDPSTGKPVADGTANFRVDA